MKKRNKIQIENMVLVGLHKKPDINPGYIRHFWREDLELFMSICMYSGLRNGRYQKCQKLVYGILYSTERKKMSKMSKMTLRYSVQYRKKKIYNLYCTEKRKYPVQRKRM